MGSILIHTQDESVTLTAQAVRRLLDKGDGDAALLYLALLRHHGTVQPRSLAGELRWDRLRRARCGNWAWWPPRRRLRPRRMSVRHISAPTWRSGWSTAANFGR